MSQSELPTTDGELAVINLDGSLRSAEAMLARRPQDPVSYGRLVSLLCARGQYLGRIADYERASDIAEQAVKAAPKDWRSYLARAQTRSIFHEFEAALADLEQASKLDADGAAAAEERRASILAALGKLDDALALTTKLAEKNPHIVTIGAQAALLAERGDIARADALFIEAQRHFPDVAPFPVAWLYVQHGLMWETAGNLTRAHELFTAAHERLPAYAVAASHLAAIEAARAQRSRAIELLRPLISTSDDPEHAGQLAGLLKEAGQEQEAERLRIAAKARYAELLARHPQAFASHAVRFYLGAGSQPKAAVEWAERNLKYRATGEAYSLAVEANALAGTAERACGLADQMEKLPYLTPRMHVTAARAFVACGQRERADSLLRSAGKSTP